MPEGTCTHIYNHTPLTDECPDCHHLVASHYGKLPSVFCKACEIAWPVPPSEGMYMLLAIDGVVQWVRGHDAPPGSLI